MENVEEKSSNGDTNCAEDVKKVNGTAKPASFVFIASFSSVPKKLFNIHTSCCHGNRQTSLRFDFDLCSTQVEGRGKCGKCTKSRAGKESSNGKQQAKDNSMDDGTKALESLKKSLSSVQNSDEKVTILCEKYADLLEENRKLSVI
jgi:hypothetical protein